MKLLAIETASSACSAALFADDRVAAARHADMERGQAEALMPMVADVLAEAASVCPRGFADLDLIAVTVGPGAFTGVRIGLAAAGAMAAAAGLPAVGLTTLEVVAAAETPDGLPLLVALDAKRSDVYCQLFDAALTPLWEPRAILPTAIPPLLPDSGAVALAGDAAAPVAAALRAAGRTVRLLPGHGRPEATVLARLAAARWQGRLPAAGAPLRPLYLRAPDVTLPKAGA
jgi:tRNA threonylcarbamoyladenosine biosynthesis protein TsaB